MRTMYPRGGVRRAVLRRSVLALVCSFAVPWLVLAPAAMADTAAASSPSATQGALGAATATGQTSLTTPPAGKVSATATLQQCATATVPQTERSATFAGEMTAVPGTVRMEMRIDLEELAPGETQYRTVSAPGLGVWHGSTAGVKVFTHIQQVTNLSAPALYRGALRFRWVSARGHTIKVEELRTARCEQPAPPVATGPTTGSTSASATDANGTPSA